MTIKQLRLDGAGSVPDHLVEARNFIIDELLDVKPKFSANDLHSRFPGWGDWSWAGSMFRTLIKKKVLVRLNETVPSTVPESNKAAIFVYSAGPNFPPIPGTFD